MGKRKKKKKNKAYKEKQAFYNNIFNDVSTEPGQVREIALKVFGSTYFTIENSVKK